MPVINPNPIGGAVGTILPLAGAPTTGTNEVQTITIGGTPTGGTFIAYLNGVATSAISWSATNATLVANIDAALEALSIVGTGGVTTAVGTMTAGIGTITCTFAGTLTAKTPFSAMTFTNSMTGTSPTISAARTTPGVRSAFGGASAGAFVADTTNGKGYINSGTGASPTWTVVGAQS